MDRERETIDVVYILGFGHSGSTLLSLILGGLESIAAVGEIWALPDFIRKGLPCSCGQRLSTCAFWSDVLAGGEEAGLSASIARHPAGKDLSRRRKLKALLLGRFCHLYSPDKVQAFAETESVLLGNVLRGTGARIVLDASKFIDRLIKLRESPQFRVKVIHLLRDGRATLESAKRALEREEAPRTELNRLRFILSWTALLNLQVRFCRTLPEEDYMRLTYRTLTTQPERSIERICRFLGVTYEERILDVTSDRYFGRREHHIVGGNRLTSRPLVDRIVYRERWPEALSAWEKALFALVGGVANARFVKDGPDRGDAD